MSYRPPLEPLTQRESDFAATNHDMVFRFLKRFKLNRDEYYDIVIMRYLRVCKRYCCEEQLQKFAFSTIAFRAMSSAVYNYHKSLRRKFTLSLDALCSENGTASFGELLPDPKADTLKTVIDRETIREYYSERKVKT